MGVVKFFSILSFSHGWAHSLNVWGMDFHCLFSHDPLWHYLGYVGTPALIFAIYFVCHVVARWVKMGSQKSGAKDPWRPSASHSAEQNYIFGMSLLTRQWHHIASESSDDSTFHNNNSKAKSIKYNSGSPGPQGIRRMRSNSSVISVFDSDAHHVSTTRGNNDLVEEELSRNLAEASDNPL